MQQEWHCMFSTSSYKKMVSLNSVSGTSNMVSCSHLTGGGEGGQCLYEFIFLKLTL